MFIIPNDTVTLKPFRGTPLVQLRGSLPSPVPFPGDEILAETMKAHVAREALGLAEKDEEMRNGGLP